MNNDSLAPAKAPDRPSAVNVNLDAVVDQGDRPDPDSVEMDEGRWTAGASKNMVAVVRALYAAGHKIVLVTPSRVASMRQGVEEWAARYVAVRWEQLLLREDDDIRRDDELLASLYTEHIQGRYEVTCVIDQRLGLVHGWRELGLDCLRVDQARPGGEGQ